jgi:hypothetical protein
MVPFDALTREMVPFDAPTHVYSTRSLRAAMALTVPSCAIDALLPSEMSAPMRRCRRQWRGTVPSAAKCCRPCQHGRALGPAAQGRQRPAVFAPVLRRRCNHLMHRRIDRCMRWAMHHTATQTGAPVMQPSTQPEGGHACKQVGEEAKVRHKRRDATSRQDEPRARRVTRPGRAPRRGRREEPARDQRGLDELDGRAKHDLHRGACACRD